MTSTCSPISASARSCGLLCDDLDLYPDDVFSQLAEHMGFSEQYDAAIQPFA